MKVAMIGLRGIPRVSGGIESVMENLAPELVRQGVGVTVYCRAPYFSERLSSFKGVKLRYLPTIKNKYAETLLHSLLCTLDCVFRDYDIVHYHAMGNSFFSFIPRIFGKRTVVTIHGLDWQRQKWGVLAKLFLKLGERASVICPSVTTAVSRKLCAHFKAKYQVPVVYIPNGVESPSKAESDVLTRYGLKKGSYVLFLSRIVPEKGLHDLIEAYRKVNTDKKLVVVGSSRHTDAYLEKVRKLASRDSRVIFTGAMYGDDKATIFRNASLFVLPSYIEGMPVVLLEAMSFGICPLVSDIEENLEVLGSYGMSFRVGDQAHLASRISYALSHGSEVKRRAADCREMVFRKFDWKSIAKDYRKVYGVDAFA